MFLTLEGPEGAGKSTQGRLLADAIRATGREVVLVREPGGTEVGERIRGLLLDPGHRNLAPRTEMLLFAAARAQLVAEVVRPALSAGLVVVCDRYVDASLVYQGVGRHLGVDVVRAVNEVGTDGLLPDLTILLDIDPAVGLDRARRTSGQAEQAGRWDGGDRLERESLAFHEGVREGFLTLAGNEPRRIRVLDARGSVEDVHRAIWELVGGFLRGEPGDPRSGIVP